MAASPCEGSEGPGGHTPDAAALERRHDHAEAGGYRRPRGGRAAWLRLSRRGQIGRIAADVASLACRRFHHHCAHSLSARSAALRSRFHRSLGRGVSESGPDLDRPGDPFTRQPRSTPTGSSRVDALRIRAGNDCSSCQLNTQLRTLAGAASRSSLQQWSYCILECALPSVPLTVTPNFFATRAIRSSSLERNSFRVGDTFALL